MSRGWKRAEVYARKSQYCCEGNVKGNFGQDTERKKKESSRECFHLPRGYVNNHEQNISGHTDVNGDSAEVSDENGEHVIKN